MMAERPLADRERGAVPATENGAAIACEKTPAGERPLVGRMRGGLAPRQKDLRGAVPATEKTEKITYGFIGTGAFAARCLERLSEWQPPVFIATVEPRPAGRGRRPSPSRVAELAASSTALSGVPVYETADASNDERVLAERVSFTLVIDFGQRIREPLLREDERVGCLNIHPSLLPLYRGAAPVQRAILDRAGETGVTIFKLTSGMDDGPVLAWRSVEIGSADAGELLDRAADVGAAALIELASAAPPCLWEMTPQDGSRATYADKISREEERLDWNRPAAEVLARIRALSPRPGAWTTLDGRRLRILAAAPAEPFDGEPGALRADRGSPAVRAADGALELTRVQAEGKRVQSAAEWKNGLRGIDRARLI